LKPNDEKKLASSLFDPKQTIDNQSVGQMQDKEILIN